jgi:hypothetical protein
MFNKPIELAFLVFHLALGTGFAHWVLAGNALETLVSAGVSAAAVLIIYGSVRVVKVISTWTPRRGDDAAPEDPVENSAEPESEGEK